MSTEEVSKLPRHPPYPEMIMAAIEALDEEGSNKSAIAKYIASTYQDLPESHPSLLTAHLARMKESGELLFVKNNYVRPGPDAPPKRGRGRPPKPKPEGAAAAAVGAPSQPPRPRGRPPKPKDPLAEAVAKATSGMPRRRGRPPKKAARPAEAVAGSAAAAVGVVKRGRGRPPKAKPATAASDDAV